MANETRSDVFEYIEMFYNTKRHHSDSGNVSPIQFDSQYRDGLKSA